MTAQVDRDRVSKEFATPCKLRDNNNMERIVTKTALHPKGNSPNADLLFWLAQPVEARIAAVEMLRQQYINAQPNADTRFQRVCRITQLKQG